MKKLLFSLLLIVPGALAYSQISAPYNQSFDTTTTPLNWSTYNLGGDDWNFSTAADYDAILAGDHTGNSGNYAWVDFSSTDDDSVCLESPSIDVSGLTVPELTFYFFSHNTNSLDLNILFVEAWNGSTWVQIDSLQEDNGGWTEYIYDLTTFKYASDSVKIRFRAETGGGIDDYYNDLLIDDFNVAEQPTCPKVSNVLAYKLTADSVYLTWTSGVSDSSWIIEYDTAGFTLGTGMSISSGNDTVLIGGLFPDSAYEFYVRSICTVGDSSIWIGPLKVTTLISCPAPSFAIANLSNNSADVVISSGYYDSAYILEYDTTGFLLGTGIVVNSVNDTINISGLTGNTGYTFYLRSICTVGDTSLWVGPITITTFCDPDTTPWVDDVEAFVATTSSIIGNCWASTPSNTSSQYRWDIDDSGSTPSSGTGPSSARSGSKYFYTEASSGSGGDTAILTSPIIDVTNLSIPALSFYYHMHGISIGTLHVEVFDGSTWNNVLSIVGQQQPNQSDSWVKRVIDISSFGDTVQVRFLGVRGGSYEGDISLDDISIEEAPSCYDPNSLVVYDVRDDSVSLTWDTASTDSLYQIQYGPIGFTPGMGLFADTTHDSIIISNLDPAQTYDFYIRNICSVGDTSAWFGPVTITTACPDSGFMPPYLQDFGTYVPICWEEAVGVLTDTSFLTYGGSQWTDDGFGNVGSTGSARMEIWSTSRDEWLISPSIDLGSGSIDYQLEFDVALTEWNTTNSDTMQYDDTLALLISTDNGMTWSNANLLDVWNDGNEPSSTGDSKIYSLIGYTGLVKFAFYARSSVSGEDVNVYIDNFWVREVPLCVEPDSIYSVFVGEDSAVISWNQGPADSTWIVEYGISGFTQGLGMYDTLINDTTYFSGLLPNTSYDIYVRSICNTLDSSIWVGPFTFRTTCPAVFVAPYYDSVEDHLPVTNADISNCWSTNPSLTTSLFRWNVNGSGSTPSIGTGPSGAHSGVNYFYVEASDGSQGDSTFLYSPMVDLSGLSIPAISFFYHMHGEDMGSLHLDVYSGSTWNYDVWTISGEQHPSQGDQWTQAFVDLSTFNDTVQARFRVVRGSSYEGDVSIDNIAFEDGPSCFDPSGLTAVFIADDSVSLAWNAGLSDSTYVVEYGALGFVLGTGNQVDTTVNTIGVSGLSANSTYDFYLRTICSLGDSSKWIGPLTVKTNCATYVPPYFEDFSSFLPTCWESATGPLTTSSTLTLGNNDWIHALWTNQGIDSAVNLNIWTAHDEWLISPPIDLGSGSVDYIVEFDAAVTDWLVSGPDVMGATDVVNLVISVDNGNTWSDTNILLTIDQSSNVSNTGDHFYAILNGYTGIVKFGIYATSPGSTSDYDFHVDNFVVDTMPPCLDPYGLVAYGAGTDSILVTWISGPNDSVWLVEYGPTGFTPGTGTITTSTNDTVSVNGLSVDTEYDFYVRGICKGNDTSAYVGPATDTTLPLCLRTVAFTILTSDSTSINVGWNVDPSHTEFIVEYGPTGFTPGTGTTGTVLAPNNFYQATGLTPLTSYDFYVRAVCLSGDSSVWDGPFTGKTSCASTAATLPYLEDFSTWEPVCWSLMERNLATDSIFTDSTNSSWQEGGFANLGAAGATKLNIYGTSTKDWLISPSIDLGSDPSRHKIIEFDAALTDWVNASPPSSGFGFDDTVALIISPDNGITWDMANAVIVFDTANTPSYTGDHIYHALLGYSGVVKFGFYGVSTLSNEDNDFHIDNFSLKDSVYASVSEIINHGGKFLIYPNPNNGVFSIQNLGESAHSYISIVDIQGRKVFEKNIYINKGTQKQIRLSADTEKGVYILSINSNGVTSQHRVVID